MEVSNGENNKMISAFFILLYSFFSVFMLTLTEQLGPWDIKRTSKDIPFGENQWFPTLS